MGGVFYLPPRTSLHCRDIQREQLTVHRPSIVVIVVIVVVLPKGFSGRTLRLKMIRRGQPSLIPKPKVACSGIGKIGSQDPVSLNFSFAVARTRPVQTKLMATICKGGLWLTNTNNAFNGNRFRLGCWPRGFKAVWSKWLLSLKMN